MDETNIAQPTEATETGSEANTVTQENQAETSKTFSQEDVDRIVQNRLKQVEKKYEGINVGEYQQLKSQQVEAEKKSMIKKEQFEELLQKQKSEYDTKLTTLQSELVKTRVDGSILTAAAEAKAVNPAHIVDLMKNNVRLGDNGQVEVLDTDGQVRYNTESAAPMTIDEAVGEFIVQNPYFRSAQPSGSGSTGNTHSASREVKLSDLNMNDPEHRKIYREKFEVGQARKFASK